MLQQYCCCCRRSEEPPKPIDDETPPIQSTSQEGGEKTARDSEKVKEVSAAMVVFTKVVPKALRTKDRRHPAEGEMDHVNGMRLEVL
jgi:hypothetical protein